MKRDPESSPPLVFEWRRPRAQGPGLFTWLLATLLGMAAFFYIFKVVYPQSQRFTPIPQQVFVLDPGNPEHQGLLNRVSDKDFLIVPGNDDAAREVRLEDHAPLFHPSFENHRFPLLDLPHKVVNVSPPRLLDPQAPVLPPPDLKDLKPTAAVVVSTAKPMLALRFSGPLAARKIVHGAELGNIEILEPEACRIHIGVEASGRVAYALPISINELPPVTQQLIAALSGLRFEADAGESGGGGVTWSVATLNWSSAP